MSPKLAIPLLIALILGFPLIVSLLTESNDSAMTEEPQPAPTRQQYTSHDDELPPSSPRLESSSKSRSSNQKSDNKTPILRWEAMRELNYETGKIGDDLKKTLKDKVRIPGFVVPLDMDAQSATEFLLVPTYGACIHVPPPPPNQMILVKMSAGEAPRRENGPVWVTGKTKVIEAETAWGKVGFEMTAEMTEPYEGGY